MAPRSSKIIKQTAADKTLIIDNGADTMKAGFATASPDVDTSCHVIPNCLAKGTSTKDRVWVGSQLENCTDFAEMVFRRPVQKGYLVNWEAEKEIWDRTFFDKGAKLRVCGCHTCAGSYLCADMLSVTHTRPTCF